MARLDWPGFGYLLGKFHQHGASAGCPTVFDYDASARRTLVTGDKFKYVHRQSGLPSVGYYDPRARLLTVLSANEKRIINHFRADEAYVVGMSGGAYRPRGTP
jgi:hypothetical protein